MPRRTSPAAEALRGAITAEPAGITAFVVSGVERLAFTSAEVGQMLFGPPADDTERKNQQWRVADLRRQGLLAGRQVGTTLLIPGDALAEFVRSLGAESDRKTA